MTEPPAPAAPRPGRLGLQLAVALMLGLGSAAAGFFAARQGLVDLPQAAATAPGGHGTSFVAVPPVIVTLGPTARSRHLRLVAQIETPAADAEAVARLMPRILDVLNGYLRAVDPADIENPAAMIRLRAQMLRRVQMVAGGERALDLLIIEFILN
jgi:flagellar FliL protein